MAKKLVLYGLDGSQPCRTVSWLLRTKKVDFEYVTVMPGKQTKAKEFLDMNPWATIPVLQHGEDFFLGESAAIVTYLADYFQWTDLYPKDDLQARAKIQSWLHWHHRNSREFTLNIFAPLIRPDLQFPADRIADGQKHCKAVGKSLDQTLANSAFLLGGTGPTLADYVVFGDLGQLHKEEMDLYDFSVHPNVDKWIHRMRALPCYEESHGVLSALKRMAEKAKAKQAKL